MKIEKRIKNFFRKILRKFDAYNEYENAILTSEYAERISELKAQNSKIVFDAYYLPKAVTAILREDNYLITLDGAKERAVSMMLKDKADGILDEFYRFTV